MCLFRRLFTPRILLQSISLRGLRSRHLLGAVRPVPRFGGCFCGV